MIEYYGTLCQSIFKVIKMINIIAHRGANQVAPQNTIPAFLAALDMNVNGFENDVHLTSDGEVVVCHNDTIDATSNGKGKISDYTLDELLKFDFGSSFSEKFKGTKIPKLNEFLDVSRDDRIEIMNIEIKSQKERNSSIVEKVIKQSKDLGVFEKLIISSFDEDVLLAAKEIEKNVKTALLFTPFHKITDQIVADIRPVVKQFKLDALHPMLIMIDEKMMEVAREIGIMVNAWTVNYQDAIEHMKNLSVHSIITDVPDFASEILRK